MPATTTTLGAGRRITVLAPDGARLAAWVHEPERRPAADAPTVVLAHGWTLNHTAWLRVVAALQADTAVRVVTYDQRGHGRSAARGRGRRPAHTVRTLGDDLAAVTAATTAGPLVLAGHSMGGMTVMAYAGRHPDELAARVRGVALVSTSAGDVHSLRGLRGEGTLMRLISHLPAFGPGRLITDDSQRRLLFGDDANPADVAETRAMVAATAVSIIGRYYSALGMHDETASLAALSGVPTRVIVGERDRLTPVAHATRLAELIPHAELDVLPGLGHMLGFEAPAVVAAHLRALVTGSR